MAKKILLQQETNSPFLHSNCREHKNVKCEKGEGSSNNSTNKTAWIIKIDKNKK